MPFFFTFLHMNLFFPNNIFGRLIASNLPDALKSSAVYQPSSLLTKNLLSTADSAALIPTIDLIKNKDLYVSKSFGISFEGALCNSYLYFASEQKDITRIDLTGDVSAVEAILCKILFKEMYNTEIEIGVLQNIAGMQTNNILMVGDKNFHDDAYSTGISFAEEMVEALNLPYVNYLLASTDKSLLERVNSELAGVGSKVYDNLEANLKNEKLSESGSIYLTDNISSFIIDFDEQDVEAIEQITRLPYYHGIINDIVEVKFV